MTTSKPIVHGPRLCTCVCACANVPCDMAVNQRVSSEWSWQEAGSDGRWWQPRQRPTSRERVCCGALGSTEDDARLSYVNLRDTLAVCVCVCVCVQYRVHEIHTHSDNLSLCNLTHFPTLYHHSVSLGVSSRYLVPIAPPAGVAMNSIENPRKINKESW